MKLLLSESFSTMKRMQGFGVQAIVQSDGDFWIDDRVVLSHMDINVVLLATRGTRQQLQFVRWQAEMYTMPSAAQLESTWVLVQELLEQYPAVDQQFGGAYRTGFVWGQAPGAQGIMARERIFVGSGGLVPEFFCLARARGLKVDGAVETTLQAALEGGVTKLPGTDREAA